MNKISSHIDGAYAAAEQFAKNHYENFPVVSFLIPKGLRKHIAIIYWFARTADDYADEGTLTAAERLDKLNHFESRLDELLKGKPENDFERALGATIMQKNLPPQLFYDLLKAFKQDVIKKTYHDFDELLDYCRHSANPVGRLILQLFDIRDEKAFYYSDQICTALQLTNFYQDAMIDVKKGRIYFSKKEMTEYSVHPNLFEINENNPNLKKFVKHNIDRTEQMFDEGAGLLKFLAGRLKFEIKWTIAGGREILNKIRKNDYSIFIQRPVLNKADFIFLLLKSFV